MKALPLCAFTLGLGLLTGCISTVPKQQYLASTLAPKASFDLACPTPSLKITDLGSPVSNAIEKMGDKEVIVKDLSEQQGVTGCGKRGRYVLVDGQWVLNAGSEETAKD